MSAQGPPPRRVRVTRSTPYGVDPRRGAGAEPGPGAGAEPGDDVVEVFDADLRRTTLRWAAAVIAVVAVPLFGLPLLLLAVPSLAASDVAGVPVPWLLLGGAVYPLAWLASRWFVTGAERTERDCLESLGGGDA